MTGGAEFDAIHDALADIPLVWAQPPAGSVSKLPKPTKRDNAKGSCPECGKWHGLPAVHIDYMGHADLTLALIKIDPLWSWEPAAIDADTGGPVIILSDGRFVMWARLTLLGKTILGVGTCDNDKGEPEKELIGDFLRNAAMRFGVGTMLWSKADTADPAGSSRAPSSQGGRRGGSEARGAPRDASGSGNDPEVIPSLQALVDATGKNPAYWLAVARPIMKAHGIEVRGVGDLTDQVVATLVDRTGKATLADVCLTEDQVLPHLTEG